MSACNLDVVKLVGNYYNVPIGAACYNNDQVLSTVLNKQKVDGFASIVLRLSENSGVQMSQEQILLSYQWLEYISMYANQAVSNPAFANNFLQDINNALQKNSYLTGQFLTVADVTAYYVLYPLLEKLSIVEREKFIHLCRWSRHIQAQPNVCGSRPALPLDTISLFVLSPAFQ